MNALREKTRALIGALEMPFGTAFLSRPPNVPRVVEVLPPEETSVLLVEDNPGDARMIESLLGEVSDPVYRVRRVSSLTAALERVRCEEFDVVIFDLGLPDSSGVIGLREFAMAATGLPIVVLTGLDSDEVSVRALGNGAQDYMVKGEENARTLRRAICHAIERKQLERRLEHLASYDALTGLVGRGLFHDRLEHAIARAQREGGRVALLSVNLDGFRRVNERVDHRAGDAVLQAAAARLRAAVRETDTVARLGGDEFAVILEAAGEQGMAFEIAGKIVVAMAQGVAAGQTQVSIGSSVGVAVFPDHAESAPDLQRRAELAMRRAKQAGGGRAVVASHAAERLAEAVPADIARRTVPAGTVRVLLTEDNPGDARLVELLLESLPERSYELTHVVSVGAAAAALEASSFDVLLLDLNLPDAEGFDGLARLAAAALAMPVVMLTGNSDRQTGLEALKCGADDYIIKGRDDARTLDRSIQYAMERKRNEHSLRIANNELEQRVAERTRDLEHAMQELGAFSYSVAHDLRSPIRAIAAYAEIILRENSIPLDAESRGHLERIRGAGERMGSLVDGLLELSRLSRAEISRKPVDLAALARPLVDALNHAHPRRTVVFEAPQALPADADPDMMLVCLQNLLENAWKFTSRREDARVTLGAHAGAGEVIYTIRDNGVGFDPAYASKLFQPFQRLHTPREFPGTGIGLATVKRIVQRHGGRVWAESAIGQGTAICFTLEPAGGAFILRA